MMFSLTCSLFVLVLAGIQVDRLSASASSPITSASTVVDRTADPSALDASTLGLSEASLASFEGMAERKGARIRIIFSDVDGTLVHYPHSRQTKRPTSQETSDVHDDDDHDDAKSILLLPPSASGMQGIISCRTLRLCREIRRQDQQHERRGGAARLVLVSGMRTSTLLQRLPYLPRADAYCSEGGSRIFYPVASSLSAEGTRPKHRVVPVPFEGATAGDLQPYYVEEDEVWRQLIIAAVGDAGFRGNDIDTNDNDDGRVPVRDRKGPLWDFANHLGSLGYVLDTTGYAACFRINRKHQPAGVDFNALLRSDGPDAFAVPPGLGTSTNLGCVDVYPAMSGKKNCCMYLAERFCGSSEALRSNCVCLCDDDNDLEMALSTKHAFIPSVSSESMAGAIQQHRDHFTVTLNDGAGGTAATELALERVLNLIRSY